LKAIALFEAAKGALVLFVGCGLLRYAHADAQHLGNILVRHFHFNPASAQPRIFEKLLRQAGNIQLRWLALGAAAYAILRFVEAGGLWLDRRWAEWIALVSAAAYLPIELYEAIHTRHWAAIVVFLVNAVVVAVIAYHLRIARSRRSDKTITSTR
jgi:uncharacterized membrane protein (DUF2068 family)